MRDKSRSKLIEEHIQKDAFAAFLGAKVEIIKSGHARVSLTITEEMTNFHGMTHGGVIFALGDMAFAAAGNSRGQTAVAMTVSICYLKASKVGDRLVAMAREQFLGGPTGLYEITITEEKSGDIVAKSQDLVYRKKAWFVPER